MMKGSSRSRNFFRKLVVNRISNSKVAIQNDCLIRLYEADGELRAISTELDSFDGKKDPIRCNLLVNQLRTAQDKVISLLFQLMDDCNCKRASRDYRMKFPDEILLSEGSESLNGQIWFGAECLSAGSNILNHTKESIMLRPMARTLTIHLDSLRSDLRNLAMGGGGASRINQALVAKMVAFDHIFATFEYEYVRTMLPIRTVSEIEKLQEVAVLFSETLIDCVKRGLIKQDDIDEFQPIVMIAIPRLAIVRGLLYKNENPIYTRHKSHMCSLFQPFHGPLHSIRRLLRGLSPHELFSLEKMLANDQTAIESPVVNAQRKSCEQQKEESTSSIDNEQKNSLSTRIEVEGSNENDSCVCQDETEAGTSNSTNVLMEGLQYPVGRKRCNESPSPSNLDDHGFSCCAFESPPSSSKSNAETHRQENSPVGSSPSSSSSLSSSIGHKNCLGKKDGVDDRERQTSENHDCDKNCCLSPPESDTQLEKLIADFSPSIDNSNPAQPVMNNTIITSIAQDMARDTAPVDNLSASAGNLTVENSTLASSKSTKTDSSNRENEALLEELFIKQAQQLLHRLFVAISGVADQLQSNFASDLRFILRHIFSSEIEGANANSGPEDIDDDDDNDSDGREYSNNEQSDSSLPIEQGIEAQEVGNLIDLGSNYSLNSPYEYENDVHYVHQANATSTTAYMNSPNINSTGDDLVTHLPPLYASTVTPQQSNEIESLNNNSRAFHDNVDQDVVNEEILADLMCAADQPELIYESRTSPNETSIMDDSRHHQQLVQQHLLSISSRAPNARSSSRAHRHNQLNDSSGTLDGQNGVERRSRHYSHHGGPRPRRSRGPPVWVPDQLVVACSCCNAQFTFFRRRHHCRACGQIFCAECSKFTKNLNCWGFNGPVRVCESCFNQP